MKEENGEVDTEGFIRKSVLSGLVWKVDAGSFKVDWSLVLSRQQSCLFPEYWTPRILHHIIVYWSARKAWSLWSGEGRGFILSLTKEVSTVLENRTGYITRRVIDCSTKLSLIPPLCYLRGYTTQKLVIFTLHQRYYQGINLLTDSFCGLFDRNPI